MTEHPLVVEAAKFLKDMTEKADQLIFNEKTRYIESINAYVRTYSKFLAAYDREYMQHIVFEINGKTFEKKVSTENRMFDNDKEREIWLYKQLVDEIAQDLLSQLINREEHGRTA